MRAIFISYRRNDSEGEAGRLFDDLTDAFSDQSVFMDVAAIEPGKDFRRAIDDSVTQCSVLLAIIGPGWLEVTGTQGRRRLDEDNDSVRLEITSALKRDIPVIPILVRGTKMPAPEQLPPDLRDLSYRNAIELSHARWKSDIRILIQALTPHLRATPSSNGASSSAEAESSTAFASTIDPVLMNRIGCELAQHIGPIAEIMLKRAAKRSGSLTELYTQVAQEIESRTDREEFLDSCRRLQSTFTSPPTT